MVKTAHRYLAVEAERAVIEKKIPTVMLAQDWELLIEIAHLIQQDADRKLALHDPARYQQIRNGVTEAHLRGFGYLSERRIRAVLRGHGLPQPLENATRKAMALRRGSAE